jgi:hypothetical protein
MLSANFGDKYIPSDQIKIGLEVDSSAHEISRRAADVIVHELKSIGFDSVNNGVTRNLDPAARPIVYITVYSKPEEAQGEAKIRQRK